MKLLTRDFNTREKVLILILSIILIVLLYYKCIDQPVREDLANAEAELENLQTEEMITASKLSKMRGMDEELKTAKEIDDIGVLYAYDNGKAEVTLLNDILSEAETYSVSMGTVATDGDLVRRNFSLTYTALDYDTACDIMENLADSPYRCRISNISIQPYSLGDSEFITTGEVTVQLNAVFYETTASLE